MDGSEVKLFTQPKRSEQYRSETQSFLELFLEYLCIAYELFNKAHIGYPTHSYAKAL